MRPLRLCSSTTSSISSTPVSCFLLKFQGMCDEAELEHRKVARSVEELRPHHPHLGTTLENPLCFKIFSALRALVKFVFSVFASQGKLEEAEPLLKSSLDILEKALGPDHLDMAVPLNTLAISLHLQVRSIRQLQESSCGTR